MNKNTSYSTASAWEKLFEQYNILSKIEEKSFFRISASAIKEYREPRLMAKFDHKINLPDIFKENDLAILPVTRGDYVIAHFDAYHTFEKNTSKIERVELPQNIQSIDLNDISSEAIALNCASAASILNQFLNDEGIIPTVSGRMGSGSFSFKIGNTLTDKHFVIEVNNSQIEIDAAYEGINNLSIFEAKRDISEDFLVRQLYYPYRTWCPRIWKKVRTVFFVYSNGIYHLYEYAFERPDDYCSIVLVKQKSYSIEETNINAADIESLLSSTHVCDIEPQNIPFPQADSFDRVVNLCEILNEKDMTSDEITEQYAFDSRQTGYYTNAALYLGLVAKEREDGEVFFRLTSMGKQILGMRYKQRQLEFCRLIISHQAFHETLHQYFTNGKMPEKGDIVLIMKRAHLVNIESDETFGRRAGTISRWINWIVDLINE